MTNTKTITKSEYFRDVNAMFPFEDWMIGSGDGWYGLASAMELAGVKDGENIRVSAAHQRKLFGRVVFGKQCVRIRSGAGFETVKSQAFGQDWDVQTIWLAHWYVQDGVWHRRADDGQLLY